MGSGVARELHDEVGQALTGLKLMLEAEPRAGAPGRAPAAERLRAAQDVVERLIGQVRDLSLDLRPSMLDDLGLLPALLWQFERYTAQTGVQVDFRHRGLERRLAPDVETTAYRLVQEALSNVRKHAKATRASIALKGRDRQVEVVIQDNGRGFEVEEALDRSLSQGHIGLHSMRERAELVGGTLVIDSNVGKGTRLTFTLPRSP